jgi:hypothetical protein
VVLGPMHFETAIDEKIAVASGGIFSYGLHQGERRNQGTVFPVVLDDFVPTDYERKKEKIKD